MIQENENKEIISKIKAVYDKFMDKLGNLHVKEREIMKEYKEDDRQEKIKEIKKQLGV